MSNWQGVFLESRSVVMSVVAHLSVALQLFTQDRCPSHLLDMMSTNGNFCNGKGFSLLSCACTCFQHDCCNATWHPAPCAWYHYTAVLGIQFFVGKFLVTLVQWLGEFRERKRHNYWRVPKTMGNYWRGWIIISLSVVSDVVIDQKQWKTSTFVI